MTFIVLYLHGAPISSNNAVTGAMAIAAVDSALAVLHACCAGNWEAGDADLAQTAVREAREEMGHLPQPMHFATISVSTTNTTSNNGAPAPASTAPAQAGQAGIVTMGSSPGFQQAGIAVPQKLGILTRRGKAQQKEFTVFPVALSSETRAAYVPQLNHEHSEFAWMPFEHLSQRLGELHPVVCLLLTQQMPALRAGLHALGLAGTAAD